jgi:hypothetical protein
VSIVIDKLKIHEDISELKEMAKRDEDFMRLVESSPQLIFIYESKNLAAYYGHKEEYSLKTEDDLMMIIRQGLLNQGRLVMRQWRLFEEQVESISSTEEKNRVMCDLEEIIGTSTTNLFPHCDNDVEIKEIWSQLVDSHMILLSLANEKARK